MSKNKIDQAGNKEAITLWHTVMLKYVQNASFDLSSRQMTLLLSVYTQRRNHTIKSLAEDLKISKPAVCRAVDVLSKHKFIKRIVDKNDRRSVIVSTTDEGYQFLGVFSDDIMNVLVEL